MTPLPRPLLILTTLLCLVRATNADDLQVGVAETDLTPPEGVGMSGYYHERFATATKDPLKARAVAFRQGDTRAAFVVCDMIGISRDLYVAASAQASEQTGIPINHIVVAGTHSHTAPDYRRLVYESLMEKPFEVPGENKHPYAVQLIEAVAGAIVAADAAAQPVALLAGSAEQKTPVSFNRRSVMADGSVQTWQSASNPQRLRAAGPIDPEIGLLLIRPKDAEKPIGLVSNFALHLDTVGGTEWSADYPFLHRTGAAEAVRAGLHLDLRNRILRRHQSRQSRLDGAKLGRIHRQLTGEDDRSRPARTSTGHRPDVSGPHDRRRVAAS